MGSADMFKQQNRKSRKNILSLMKATIPDNEKESTHFEVREQKGNNEKKARKYTVSSKGNFVFEVRFMIKFISDEGYITGNEKIYKIQMKLRMVLLDGMLKQMIKRILRMSRTLKMKMQRE